MPPQRRFIVSAALAAAMASASAQGALALGQVPQAEGPAAAMHPLAPYLVAPGARDPVAVQAAVEAADGGVAADGAASDCPAGADCAAPVTRVADVAAVSDVPADDVPRDAPGSPSSRIPLPAALAFFGVSLGVVAIIFRRSQTVD